MCVTFSILIYIRIITKIVRAYEQNGDLTTGLFITAPEEESGEFETNVLDSGYRTLNVPTLRAMNEHMFDVWNRFKRENTEVGEGAKITLVIMKYGQDVQLNSVEDWVDVGNELEHDLPIKKTRRVEFAIATNLSFVLPAETLRQLRRSMNDPNGDGSEDYEEESAITSGPHTILLKRTGINKLFMERDNIANNYTMDMYGRCFSNDYVNFQCKQGQQSRALGESMTFLRGHVSQVYGILQRNGMTSRSSDGNVVQAVALQGYSNVKKIIRSNKTEEPFYSASYTRAAIWKVRGTNKDKVDQVMEMKDIELANQKLKALSQKTNSTRLETIYIINSEELNDDCTLGQVFEKIIGNILDVVKINVTSPDEDSDDSSSDSCVNESGSEQSDVEVSINKQRRIQPKVVFQIGHERRIDACEVIEIFPSRTFPGVMKQFLTIIGSAIKRTIEEDNSNLEKIEMVSYLERLGQYMFSGDARKLHSVMHETGVVQSIISYSFPTVNRDIIDFESGRINWDNYPKDRTNTRLNPSTMILTGSQNIGGNLKLSCQGMIIGEFSDENEERLFHTFNQLIYRMQMIFYQNRHLNTSNLGAIEEMKANLGRLLDENIVHVVTADITSTIVSHLELLQKKAVELEDKASITRLLSVLTGGVYSETMSATRAQRMAAPFLENYSTVVGIVNNIRMFEYNGRLVSYFGLSQMIESLEEIQNRVYTPQEKLKNQFILGTAEEEGHVILRKMMKQFLLEGRESYLLVAQKKRFIMPQYINTLLTYLDKNNVPISHSEVESMMVHAFETGGVSVFYSMDGRRMNEKKFTKLSYRRGQQAIEGSNLAAIPATNINSVVPEVPRSVTSLPLSERVHIYTDFPREWPDLVQVMESLRGRWNQTMAPIGNSFQMLEEDYFQQTNFNPTVDAFIEGSNMERHLAAGDEYTVRLEKRNRNSYDRFAFLQSLGMVLKNELLKTTDSKLQQAGKNLILYLAHRDKRAPIIRLFKENRENKGIKNYLFNWAKAHNLHEYGILEGIIVKNNTVNNTHVPLEKGIAKLAILHAPNAKLPVVVVPNVRTVQNRGRIN